MSVGKAHRQGVSLIEIMDMFPDDVTAEKWFINRRWPNGIVCPECGSVNVNPNAKHKTMPFRCREKECGKRFSAKTGTVMEGSKLGFRVWALAIYQLTTNLKSVSSMKLHRDLKINQRSAWFLAHRLRTAIAAKGGVFDGPVEVDETYFGGRRQNMSNSKRKELADNGRGPAGKTAVVGAKDRASNKVAATVYTDDSSAYKGLPFDHDTVTHSLSEYVKGDVHTNGIESLWSMLKRAHKISPKHLDRYIQEFAGRHNLRNEDTVDIMAAIATGMGGKRLRYTDLIADNGLESGVRA